MPIFRWGHHWSPLGDLEREVDRLLRSVNLTFQSFRPARQYPPLNVYELDDEYLLTAELAGTKIEDLELTIGDGILTLKGQRHDPADVPEELFRRNERFRGSWQRSVSIPERVDEEALRANLSHGVLVIHLPKARQAQPRQIRVVEGET
ncbi:MAG: Hsp20/alpha crystallin family protein [Planctomycetes bacterium]|nr:Hsp20/alpha crystallin family protein [Planctomycetota bacterium]